MGVLWTGVCALIRCALRGHEGCLSCDHSILLGDALGRTFHQEQWQQDLINHVSIHTLNYRKVGEVSKNANGYYWHILK